MKIPSNIFGKNKVRDAIICKLYAEGYSPEEIKETRNYPFTVRRIEQIIYKNRAFVKIDKEWEETKQIHRIQRRIKKSQESRKDVFDWETLLDSKITPKRVEHSGEVKTGETKIIIIRPNDYAERKRMEEVLVSQEPR